MLRPRTIILKNPIEMHYVRNGPESQLWLFQFHECYFFIKKRGGGGGLQKRNKHNKGGGGRPYQQARLLKNGMEQAWQLGQHLFAL